MSNDSDQVKLGGQIPLNKTQPTQIVTQPELQDFVMQISKTYFQRPFNHVATFNKRLKTTGGRYLLASHHLEFNEKMVGLPEFEGIVKHELVHYHLHLQQLGYQHKDLDFKKLLAQVGGSRFAPHLKKARTSNHFWLYHCENKHDIVRKRHFQASNYRCGQCGTKIYFVGEIGNE